MAQLSDTEASSVAASEGAAVSGDSVPNEVRSSPKTSQRVFFRGCEQGELGLQDEVKLHKVGDLRGHESRVFSAEFSPRDDGLLVTCSEDATCRVRRPPSERSQGLSGHPMGRVRL